MSQQAVNDLLLYNDYEDTPTLDTHNSELYHYFMNIAILSAKKRKNYKNQAGACIVNATNKIVGIGNYKKSELNKKSSNPILAWFANHSINTTTHDNNNDNKSRTDYVNHAEMQAILNKTEMNLDNCIMFV